MLHYICVYLQQEAVDKTRREYRCGVNHLEEWLDNAETLISSPVNCNLQELRARVKSVDVSRM